MEIRLDSIFDEQPSSQISGVMFVSQTLFARVCIHIVRSNIQLDFLVPNGTLTAKYKQDIC